MPNLMDIAIMKVGKATVNDVEKSLIRYKSELLPKTELKMTNKLKTDVYVGSETDLKKSGRIQESKGIFASWCDKLNRPSKGIFKLKPINKLPSAAKREKRAKRLAEEQAEFKAKLDAWRAEVDEKLSSFNLGQ